MNDPRIAVKKSRLSLRYGDLSRSLFFRGSPYVHNAPGSSYVSVDCEKFDVGFSGEGDDKSADDGESAVNGELTVGGEPTVVGDNSLVSMKKSV